MGSSQWVFGLVVILIVSANIVHAITCPEAITTLMPCLSFLVGYGPAAPAAACCQGVQAVKDKATTTQVRRDLCDCFKNAVKSFGIKTDRAKSLPQLCRVSTPVPIDPSVQCGSIQ
ncbi:LTP_2 domain-containing protein [Cephalotus follicularis]|uniref:LTP_2 domain-containing protein n=1 Tax=Cephalotus follicularis TaxID=3775 RepID=A0A1Q3AZN9_CEPFO|nr:LTP_2 domain-containing protein [Cephalotus follicularis]